MPVISFASCKGGAGKTTACMIFASELARNNIDFTIIDADPNKHLYSWSKSVGIRDDLVISSTEEDIIENIDGAKTKYVLIDLEGTQNVSMGYAVSYSDLVVIPCKPSDLDGKEAVKMVKFIRQQEKVSRRNIKSALLRTQTNAAIITNIEKMIVNDFVNAGCEVFRNRLIERDAYRRMVSNKSLIHDLSWNTKQEKERVDKAIHTAREFSLELIEKLKDNPEGLNKEAV